MITNNYVDTYAQADMLLFSSEVLSDGEREKFIAMVKGRKGPTGWAAQSPLFINPGKLRQDKVCLSRINSLRPQP